MKNLIRKMQHSVLLQKIYEFLKKGNSHLELICLIFIFLTIFKNTEAFAQGDSVQIGWTVKLNNSVKFYPDYGIPNIEGYYILDNHYIFFIKEKGIEKTIKGVVYYMVSIPGKPQVTNEQNSLAKTSENNQHVIITANNFGQVFWVAKTEFDSSVSPHYVQSRLTYGFLLVPFKYRYHWNTNNKETIFAFEPTYGAAMGITLGKSRFFDNRLQLLFSGGITGFNGNYVTDTAKISQLTKDKNTMLGFTFCTGLVVKINKFQLCALYGYDLTASSANWSYNKAPWFSLGVGVPLFNSKETTGNVYQNQ